MLIRINTKVTFIFSILALLTMTVLQAKAEGLEKQTQVEQYESTLIRVDSKYVCMINDQHFNKEQIPVEVDGETYYGCCEMCKTKLKTDPKSRVAVDPVSGMKVDKALSVIGVNPDGGVCYFENEKNLQKFKDSIDQ